MVGLILGRFIPPHNGHVQLINTALAQCNRVYLALCSLKTDAIAPHMRLFWIEQLFAREIAIQSLIVIHIDKELPAAEKTKPHAPEIWAGAVTEHIPERIDAVYASESYGEAFAHALGARYVSVDPSRILVSISASQIIANPAKHWKYIPLNIRPYFAPGLHATQPLPQFTSWIHAPTKQLAGTIAQLLNFPIFTDSSHIDDFAQHAMIITAIPFDQLIVQVTELQAGIIYTLLSQQSPRTQDCFPLESSHTLSPSLSAAPIYTTALVSYVKSILKNMYGLSM